MLTKKEIEYLKTIPDRPVKVLEFNPKCIETVNKYIGLIRKMTTDLEVVHIGGTALGIPGEGDIDLLVLCPIDEMEKYSVKLSRILGDPVPGKSQTFWSLKENECDISIYLADPEESSTKDQIRVYKMLRFNPALLKEYSELKKSSASKGYLSYQQSKYEFYNRILKSTN